MKIIHLLIIAKLASKQPRVPVHERPLKRYVNEEQLSIKRQIEKLKSSLYQNDEEQQEDIILGNFL